MTLIGSGWGDLRDKSFSTFLILGASFGTTQLILMELVKASISGRSTMTSI